MIKKDYILRQLNSILEGLVNKFSKMQSSTYNPDEINDMYIKYTGQNREFFISRDSKEIAEYLLQNHSSEEAFARMSILSELLIGEAKILKDKGLQNKAIDILQYVNEHSGIFDFARQTRLSEMKKDL